MPLKYYLVSYFCSKGNVGTHGATTLYAENESEAIGHSYTYIHLIYPIKDGYTNHSVAVTEIDKENLIKLYNTIIKPIIEEDINVLNYINNK